VDSPGSLQLLTTVGIHTRSEKFRPLALSFNKINVNNNMMWMYLYTCIRL
jgi:hypothetical protein